LEELSQEYIRGARARGIAPGTILVAHALRNALLPALSSLGMSFALMLGGSVVVERVFSRIGMGAVLIDAALARDYPVVQGCALLYAALFTGINLGTDLLCLLLDPKLRRAGIHGK
jgi:peptide/nickel transport system permease protein